MEFTHEPTIDQDSQQPAAVDNLQAAPIANRASEAFRVASDLFAQQPDWVTFFRELLGINGVTRSLFPSAEEMKEFEQSKEYDQIQQMIALLRAKRGESADEGMEPTRVITVRLPLSLHESLKTEAVDRETSMNKLCISKLLQVIGESVSPRRSGAKASGRN